MRLRFFISTFAAGGVSVLAAPPVASSGAGSSAEPLPPIFVRGAPHPDARSEEATQPAPSASSPRRTISPEMMGKLSAIALRAAPFTTPSASVTPSVPSSDSSNVVRLKPYVVQEHRPPRFKQRELLTPKGKLALARHRYPGLGPLGDATALMLLEEDFARERRQEAADLRALVEIGGAKPSGELKRKIDEATMLPSGLAPHFGAPYRLPK